MKCRARFAPWCGPSLTAWACMLLTLSAQARVITVGPQGELQRIAQAADIAQDGDVIEIAAGVYLGDVAVWKQKRLTLRGVGGRPVLMAGGRSAEGKAIWVIKNGSFSVSNLEFRGSRVPDGNGAGIRFERGSLSVRDCVFEDNQNGILTSNFSDAVLSIENTRFAKAPQQSKPPPHLLYVGQIDQVRIRGSRFESGYVGHLIKSRARRSELHYNLIHDGPSGRASYEVEFPNGGKVTLVGNIIEQGPDRSNSALIAYGAEGRFWPENRLDMAHNTVINDGLLPAWFLRAWTSTFAAGLEFNSYNNLWIGLGFRSPGLTGVISGDAHGWRHQLKAPRDLDFRLDDASEMPGGAAVPIDDLRPTDEFSLPIGVRPIARPSAWLPGAIQSSTAKRL